MRIAAGFVALALIAQDGRSDFARFKGKKPPEWVTVEAEWINTKKPLTLELLRGMVVLLEFTNHK
jgi:hypothetical protein